MKYKYNGQWYDVSIKALDSMPVGTIVEYDGQASDIPTGWEQVTGQNKIKKTSETTPTMASIVDGYNTSTQNGYSCNYVNNAIPAVYDNYSASDSDGYSCNYVNGKTGVVLYNNSNGAITNIQLSDSTWKYSKIDIYYGKSSSNSSIKSIFNFSDGTYQTLYSCDNFNTSGVVIQEVFKRISYTENTKTINSAFGFYRNVNADGTFTVYQEDEVKIYKVVGYK